MRMRQGEQLRMSYDPQRGETRVFLIQRGFGAEARTSISDIMEQEFLVFLVETLQCACRLKRLAGPVGRLP